MCVGREVSEVLGRSSVLGRQVTPSRGSMRPRAVIWVQQPRGPGRCSQTCLSPLLGGVRIPESAQKTGQCATWSIAAEAGAGPGLCGSGTRLQQWLFPGFEQGRRGGSEVFRDGSCGWAMVVWKG